MRIRKIFILSLFVTFFAWMAPALAHSATYYVAKTGSDSYSCAQAQSAYMPKRTIADGLECMKASDTLIITAGTYAEGINDTIPSGSTKAAHTIIKAASGDSVRIQPTKGVGPTGNVIYITNNSNITIDGLIIDGAHVTGQGIYTSGNTSNIRIQNNDIKTNRAKNLGNCVTIQGDSTAVEIINNKIHDCGTTRYEHGVYLWNSNHLVEHNEIYNVSGHGIHVYKSGRNGNNNIMRYNYIHNNGSRCAIVGSGDNQLFHHNICANNGYDGVRVDVGSPNNVQIYNNTLYKNAGECIDIGGATNTKVKNNLCLSNKNNSIVNNGKGTVLANNRLSTDVTLVIDAANDRFSPRAGSPLIHAGEIIAGFSHGKFVGIAPAQGAVESVGSNVVSKPAVPTTPIATIPAAPISLQVHP